MKAGLHYETAKRIIARHTYGHAHASGLTAEELGDWLAEAAARGLDDPERSRWIVDHVNEDGTLK